MQSYKITSFDLEIKRDGNKDKKKGLKIALTTFCKDLWATALASKSFFKDKLSNNTTMNAMFAIGIKKNSPRPLVSSRKYTSKLRINVAHPLVVWNWTENVLSSP